METHLRAIYLRCEITKLQRYGSSVTEHR